MKRKIVILLLLLIFFLTSCVLNGMPEGLSEREKEHYKYLKNNISNININDDSFAVLTDFNESVKDYNVFLIGEGHAVAKNYDIQFYLLKNFVENHNVRYILIESGFSDSQFLNKYLQSGDVLILDKIFEELEGIFTYSKEQYNYYINIYEYNKTLPEDKKLTFVGIDIQHQTYTAIKYLLSIIPENDPPQEILSKINEFKSVLENILGREVTTKKITELMESILEETNNKSAIYGEFFKEEYFNLKFACENLLQSFECYGSGDNLGFYPKRENYICSNFAALYEHYNISTSKWYGNWGDSHAHLVKSNVVGGKTFASFLNSEYETTKEKVLSILSIYNNCQRTNPTNYTPVDISGTYSVPVPINTNIILHSLAKYDFALFNLMNDNSPFIKRKKDTDEITYVYGFQYLLLIQNSPATTKFK